MAAKKIKNKKSELFSIDPNLGQKVELRYFDLIKECLNIPPSGGFSREDINKRNKIEESLIGEETEMDHELFHIMKKICSDRKWPTRHKGVQEFLNYLDDIK